MGLFTRKSKEPVVSAFDSVQKEVMDAVISDVILIVRLVKAWPVRMFPNVDTRAKASAEFQTFLRKAGVAAAGLAMTISDDDSSQVTTEVLAKLPIPPVLRPLVLAVYTTFVE